MKNILTEAEIFAKLPPRPTDSHKGSFGRLTCVCGCRMYRGAATLAVSAGLRAGAGIVRLAAIEPVIAACAAQVSSAIYLPLKESEDGEIHQDAAADICRVLRAEDVCLVGCGLGQTTDSRALVEALLAHAPCPLILDADACNALRGRIHLLQTAKHTPILTPHYGEFARLSGLTIAEIQADPEKHALAFAKETSAVVVLKSNVTHIVAPNGDHAVNTAGTPGMAKGGSGDLLAGLIGGFAAQGHSPFDAACIGVYLAGAAGARCAARKSAYGMLPGEQLDDLCALFLSHGL